MTAKRPGRAVPPPVDTSAVRRGLDRIAELVDRVDRITVAPVQFVSPTPPTRLLLDLTIDREAVPQPRPIVTKAGHVVSNHGEVEGWKQRVRDEARLVYWGEPVAGAVVVELHCAFEGDPDRWHVGPVDVDNLAVACLNAMAGVVYLNDRQVIRLVTEKAYHRPGGTRIRVTHWLDRVPEPGHSASAPSPTSTVRAQSEAGAGGSPSSPRPKRRG